MMRRTFLITTVVFGMITFMAGCAASGSPASDVATVAVNPTADVTGTWYGSFGQVAASLYEDEGNAVLRINADGTFVATVTRGRGTNNLANPAVWSGTVVTKGNRVILQNAHGPWPSIILTRSGYDVLYGLADDPAIEAPVMMKFERARTG